jgi:hypothetical protein
VLPSYEPEQIAGVILITRAGGQLNCQAWSPGPVRFGLGAQTKAATADPILKILATDIQPAPSKKHQSTSFSKNTLGKLPTCTFQ